MYLTKTPDIIRPLTRDLVWSIPTDKPEIFLTFDDGPHPEITPVVLSILAMHNAKATFFCIGGNVRKYPEVYGQILHAGHNVGNHTYNHMSGWEFSNFSYCRSVLECARLVESDLMRPPYGRITRGQAKALKKRFRIIMWDVLSADWVAGETREKCLRNVTDAAKPGSIVVFHDSEKAEKNMLYALEGTLKHFTEKGYSFRAISPELLA